MSSPRERTWKVRLGNNYNKYGKIAYGVFAFSHEAAFWKAASSMPKTVFTGAHKFLVETLISARKKSGLTQAVLAEALGKDQSFISNIENSQRRVDVLEFYALARAMGADPVKLYAEVVKKLPKNITI